MTRQILLLFFLALSFPGYSQKTLRAYRLDQAISIDGIFEPGKWLLADSATSFVQMEPNPGSPESGRTVAWFGYDVNNIYVAIKCYQESPVIAGNQNRDGLSKSDDLAGIIIDSYNDNRTAYAFMVNPLGTQTDFKVNDDGRNIDLNWDTEWLSDIAVFDGGWCLEMQIPFSSIKYDKNIDTWGLNFGRILRSSFETLYWSGTLTADFRVSQSGKITGIEVPESKMRFSFYPYLSVFKTSEQKVDADAGLDAGWQITPNVSLNGTYNPDFATVEADQVKINLTRYELSYPEKRLFFQEGNEMYNTRIKQFYSRRIQDINYGARLNGKIGDYQFNALNVGSPAPNDSIPGSFFSVARFKKDILNSSSVGLTMVDKSWKGGYARNIGLDYVLNLGKTWKLTGQFIGSAPGDFLESSAWFMRFARENNIYHYHVRYTSIGENFRDNVNKTGFIRDDDRKELDFQGTYKFWFNNSWLKYIDLGSNNNFFWSQAGILRSWDLDMDAEFYFTNRVSIEYTYNNEYKLFDKDYYNHQHEIELGYNTEEWSHATLGVTTGRNFNSKLLLWSAGARLKPLDKLSFSYSGQILNLDPDPEDESTFINIITVNYNFTKDLWLKVFGQTSRANDKAYLYSILGWRFKPPFGALYLIYSHDQFEMEDSTMGMDNFFIKITYPLAF